MPFFSFSIKNKSSKRFINKIERFNKKIIAKEKYYSKNTILWKILNEKKSNIYINHLQQEKRIEIPKIKKSILFCLPPSIGLGDAVEYATSIKSVVLSNKFNNYGIAFVGRYRTIFNKYFNLKNIYDHIIHEDDLLKYETIFHLTLEIDDLKLQKYERQSIEKSILNYFQSAPYRLKSNNLSKKTKKISIFPVSKSPIRTMPVNLLNYIIFFFSEIYKIEIILDNDEISNYIKKNLNSTLNYKIIIPKNLDRLLKIIEKIDFGVFMDSGPLHVAKTLQLKGILIISSVHKKNLLSGFHSIKSIKGDYKSKYCNGPCGLTNAFNFNKKSGCYDTLSLKKNIIINAPNINRKDLQRGDLKKNYLNLIKLPVNCLRNLSEEKVVKFIKKNIK